MLSTLLKERDHVPELSTMDVRFDDFMADEARDNMAGYLETHVKGRHGAIDHRADDVGLDLDELRTRFDEYSTRFLS